MSKTPAVGDPVFFEGLTHRVTAISEERGGLRFASELLHPGPDGPVPRFETDARLADLRWSDELGAWYLWGRLLSKGRGGLGENEGKVVAELRDRGILPARATRRHTSMPAGGEHVNLVHLFRRGIDWQREIARLRQGGDLTAPAAAAVADYRERFKRKLEDGFGAPDAGDSWADGEEL